jgi:hypothetical protein
VPLRSLSSYPRLNHPRQLEEHRCLVYQPCAYRKSSPSILVMQSTQDRTAQNASRCLGGT